MGIDRRRFLKLSAAASTALIPINTSAQPESCSEDFDDAYAVLVDTTVCIGCRRCELACNQEHKTSDAPVSSFEDKSVFAESRRPAPNTFTVVNPVGGHGGRKETGYVKMQCMHCNDPACASACIVGALTKCDHGPVTYDADKCIGCRYCMVACPYQIPTYEYDKVVTPRVMKCNFCTQRVHDGKRPACVEACPAEALTFGKRADLLAVAHSKIDLDPERYIDHVYGEHEVGGSSWLYLSSVDFRQLGFPDVGDDPVPHLTETIQHGIFKSFLPPLALYGLLGLIMHTSRHGRGESGDEETTS